MSKLQNIANKLIAQSTRRVDILNITEHIDGMLEVRIGINDPGRGDPEYVYYFRDPPERIRYKIENNQIFSYPQLRDVASHAFKYERVGKDSEPENVEQKKQRSREHVRELLKSLESK